MMIRICIGTLLWALNLVWMASGAEMTGYLIDNQCIRLCETSEKEASCAPDGINVFFRPEKHTGRCLLLPVCVNSGYVTTFENEE